MIKKVGMSIILLVLAFSVIQPNQQAKASSNVKRINGENRYDTAGRISFWGWNQSDAVVLASGETFPDALAGGPLAYKLNAPILLTYRDRLPEETKYRISQMQANHVYILGGTSAISGRVEKELKDSGMKITRIGGEDRFQTAAKIANYLPSDQVIVANGRNFPDALAVAPYAARHGIPIMLSEADTLPEATKTVTRDKKQSILVGGEAAISSQVASKLPSISRYGGADRYETAKKIIEGLPMAKERAYVATGANFADALSGSVLAAKENAPILLVEKDRIPSSIHNLVDSYKTFSILGGVNAVSTNVQERLVVSTEEFQFQGVHVNATENLLRSTLGDPQRIDESRYSFDWFVYNKDPKTYIQFGVFYGVVVAIYTNSDSWVSKSGLELGMGKAEVESTLKQMGAVPDQGNVYHYDNQVIRVYYDSVDENSLSGISLIREDFQTVNPDADMEELKTSMEKQLLDQANALRARHLIAPLKEDGEAREVARAHSKDMAVRNYFSHENPEGLSPFQRLDKAGIRYTSAGENIAAGQFNAIAAHDAWVNSPGHRKNILSPLFRNLGTGIYVGGEYGIYYTQDFYTP